MSNANNADNKQFFSKILNSIGAGVVIATCSECSIR